MKPSDDNDVVLIPTSGSDEFIGFAVKINGERAGTVTFRHEDKSRASIRWNLTDEHQGQLARVLKQAVDHAFAELGITRVETQIDAEDHEAIRQAARAGLRKEGVVRGNAEDPDRLLAARLASDPDPWSRDGFLGILNAGLPTKRVIGQGILRDQQGRVLLCQLTYKNQWDLPGGVVEVGESPAHGVVREIKEELDIDVTVRGLITVNWLPPWRGWDDACVFVFDLGTADSSLTDRMTLERREIAAMHWCDLATVAEQATTVTQELLTWLEQPTGHPPYRESNQEKS